MSLTAMVIGAGPAGLSASIGLAKAGFRVRVLDQKKEWQQRVCGSFLSAEASKHLQWLGLLKQVQESGCLVPYGTLYTNENLKITVPCRVNDFEGLAIPRKELEELLLLEVKRMGISIEWGIPIDNIQKHKLESDIVVMAGGRFSCSRNKRDSKSGWFGWNAEFKEENQNPGVLSLHFFPSGYFGILTFKTGISNVSGLINSSLKKDFKTEWQDFLSYLIQKQSTLNHRIENAIQISAWRGVGPLPFGQYVDSTPGLFLVGDAAGVCDPFMGEGIARALSAGPMLYNAFKNCDEPELAWNLYTNKWKRRYWVRQKMGSLLRWAIKTQFLTSTLLNVIKKEKIIQNKLLSCIHS